MSECSELFGEYYCEAEKYIQKMNLEEKIGQMFMVGYYEKKAQEIIMKKKPGGFILHATDFKKDNEYIINKINEIQDLSMKTINLPLGLAVDEEGGIVNRISKHKRVEGSFPSPQKIYNNSGIQGILNIEKEKRELLRKFKMNINLAPVADISYNPNDYIYTRTLGKPHNETSNYIAEVVESYVNDNFSCCAKQILKLF